MTKDGCERAAAVCEQAAVVLREWSVFLERLGRAREALDEWWDEESRRIER